jgi:hypothetical protein
MKSERKKQQRQSFKEAQQVSHHIPTKSPQPQMPAYALERQRGETKEPNRTGCYAKTNEAKRK